LQTSFLKKTLLILLLFICLYSQAYSQKIQTVRLDSLKYNLIINNVNDKVVKYVWIVVAAPYYEQQIIETKKDTLLYQFKSPGLSYITIMYKKENGSWSEEIIRNLKVK